MAVNSIWRSSPARMMGLSSGMDTDSLIQQTLRVHQMRIDAQMRQKTILQWKQETFTGIKDQITSFRNTFLSNLGSLTMIQHKAYNSTIASLSKETNAFSIATTINSSLGTIKIGKIASLARGASFSSAQSVSADKNGFSSNQRLDSLAFVGGKIKFGDEYTTVRVNGNDQTLTQTDANTALNAADWTSKITAENGKEVTLIKTGSGASAQYQYSLDGGITKDDVVFDSNGKFTIDTGGTTGNIVELTRADDGQVSYNDKTLAFTKEATFGTGADEYTIVQRENGQITYDGRALEFAGDAKININSKEITLKSNMTLSQMISTVNNTEGIGATLSYDRLADKFKLESKTIGGSSVLTSADVGTGDMLALFGIKEGDAGTVTKTGANAVVYINNQEVEMTTNTFDYRGMRITLREEKDGSTDTLTTHADDINVTFKRDATDAVNRIKGFIDAYNSIIKKIEGLVKERKTSSEASYGPLTDEEKSVMSEKQIAEWEAIAKKGILKNDNGLQRLATSLRSAFYESVQSAGLSPSELGLTTGSFFDGTGGQIFIDEDKLRTALEEDPEKVAGVFASTDGNKGLLWRMNDLMGEYVNKSQTNTMLGLENSIKRANEQMLKMQEKMYAEEDKLYRQFAAMETAMSKLQSQGDWFSAMLGGGK